MGRKSDHRGSGFASAKQQARIDSEGVGELSAKKKKLSAKHLHRAANRELREMNRKMKPSEIYMGVRVKKPLNRYYPKKLKTYITWLKRNDELFTLLYPRPLHPKLAMLYQVFLKKSFPYFTSYEHWMVFSATLYLRIFRRQIVKYHHAGTLDNLLQTKAHLLNFRSTYSEMKRIVKEFGYAALPRAIVDTPQGDKFIHRVPLYEIRAAMVQFTKKGLKRGIELYNDEVALLSALLPNEPLLRKTVVLYGKEYSSDITGDGPEVRNVCDDVKRVTAFLDYVAEGRSFTGIDFTVDELLDLWYEDVYHFRNFDDIYSHIASLTHGDYDDDVADEVMSMVKSGYLLRWNALQTWPTFRLDLIGSVLQIKTRLENSTTIVREGGGAWDSLNGNNGEWTGSDDVVKKRAGVSTIILKTIVTLSLLLLNFLFLLLLTYMARPDVMDRNIRYVRSFFRPAFYRKVKNFFSSLFKLSTYQKLLGYKPKPPKIVTMAYHEREVRDEEHLKMRASALKAIRERRSMVTYVDYEENTGLTGQDEWQALQLTKKNFWRHMVYHYVDAQGDPQYTRKASSEGIRWDPPPSLEVGEPNDQLNGQNGEHTGSDDLNPIFWLSIFIMLCSALILGFRVCLWLFICCLRFFVFTLIPNHVYFCVLAFITSSLLAYLQFIGELNEDFSFRTEVDGLDDVIEVLEALEDRSKFRRFFGYGFFANKSGLFNRGAGGGRNKSGRGPQAPEGGIEHALEVDANLDDPDPEVEPTNNLFIFSDTPNVQTTFDYSEVINPDGSFARLVNFEGHASPFCGITCIDLACKTKMEPRMYDELLKGTTLKFMGSDTFLEQYANSRGLNLMIQYVDNDGLEAIQVYKNNPRWRYVVLRYETTYDEDGDVAYDEDGNELGHYTLLVSAFADKINIDISGYIVNYDSFCWLPRIHNEYTYIKESVNKSEYDVRTYGERRDKLEEQDRYTHLETKKKIYWLDYEFDLSRFGVAQALDVLNPYIESFFQTIDDSLSFGQDEEDVDEGEIMRNMFYIRVGMTDQYKEFFVSLKEFIVSETLGFFFDLFPVREIVISNTRTEACLREAQLLGSEDAEKALNVIGRMKGLNTDANLIGVIGNTRTFCKDMIERMDEFYEFGNPVDVALSPNNLESIIPNLEVVADNQMDGRIGLGKNHVRGAKCTKVHHNKVVAHAPTIKIRNVTNQMGPGPMCMTDDAGLLAAFCGRSMSYEGEQDDDVVSDFTNFVAQQVEELLKSVDVSSMTEMRAEDYFREHYRKKWSCKKIDSIIDDYHKAKSMLEVNPDFFRHSCFVKFENSSKIKDGRVRVRPRLIMVMSNYLLVEYCQVLRVIEAWNHSDFMKYQVKGLTVEEFLRKVQDVTDRPHAVTDYSSFEASDIGRIRKVENDVIRKLLQKAGFSNTLRAFEEIVAPSRVLHCRAGRFYIDSRNSGDFHTSFGNGFLNVMLSMYVHHLRNPDKLFIMVAEGDDGIIAQEDCDPETLCKLGFKFSSALSGQYPGDVDFLRNRWVNGKRYLNVGRALKVVWVTTKKRYTRSTLLGIQRCAAYSMHLSSPGHPVLGALVQRLGLETSGVNINAKARRYFKDVYNFDPKVIETIKDYPREVVIDEDMRVLLAEGAEGFPPISISDQLMLEETFLYDRYPNIASALGDYDDVRALFDYVDWANVRSFVHRSPEMVELLDILDVVDFSDSIISM